MNHKTLFVVLIAGLATSMTLFCVQGQAQSSRPDLSGKWKLIEGDTGANSPLGKEGSMSQDGTSVTFQSLKVPFDGTTNTRDESVYIREYEGQWIGKAFVVSMKARTGTTPANFTDLMIVSLAPDDGMTMVIMHTTMTGKTNTYTLKYRKS